MNKYPKTLMAVGLTAAIAGCGSNGNEKPVTPANTVASDQLPLPENSTTPDPAFNIVGKGAISGCNLEVARKKIRSAIARGKFVKLLVVGDTSGNPVESIAKNREIALINPGALACKGEITAFVGTSNNMKAKTSNSYNPVEFVRKTDEEASMFAIDANGQPIADISLVPTELHFNRHQQAPYQDGLTDRKGAPYASSLPVDVMNQIAAAQSGPTS